MPTLQLALYVVLVCFFFPLAHGIKVVVLFQGREGYLVGMAYTP